MKLLDNIQRSPLCDSSCSVAVPDLSSQPCIPERMQGGIVQYIVSSCDLDWTDANIQNESYWEAAKTANKLTGSLKISGEGFNVSETTEQTTSCDEEEVTSRTWEVTISDYNVDTTGGLDVTFWNTIISNPYKWQFAFRTCEDYIFGFFDVTVKVRPVAPRTNKNFFYRELVLSWIDTLEPERKVVPFIEDVLPVSGAAS